MGTPEHQLCGRELALASAAPPRKGDSQPSNPPSSFSFGVWGVNADSRVFRVGVRGFCALTHYQLVVVVISDSEKHSVTCIYF